jgi:V8-like Glu-specific endopeptidase
MEDWNDSLWNLRDLLADLYPTVQLSIPLLKKTNLPTGRIPFDAAAHTNWFNILDEARKQKMVGDLVEEAKKDYPREDALQRFLDTGELPGIRGVDIEKDVDWEAPTDENTLEQIIGSESTLLPISFLEVGLERARSVARIVRADGSKGSGFLTGDNLLITNHHVLGSEGDALGAKAEFRYEETATGLARPVETFNFDPRDTFKTSKKDDWTVVRVQGNPNEGFGALPLEPTDPQKGDRVNIIQHPMGGPKQIALYHNVVVFVGHKRLQYLTDTMKGSSGSPVFDFNWQVVALHHSGGSLREPGTKRVYYRNEGIHINAVLEGMAAAGL